MVHLLCDLCHTVVREIQQSTMPVNENKENNLVFYPEEMVESDIPQTPSHLLKRSHSHALKSTMLLKNHNLTNLKTVSPQKKLSNRLPLASKDNNRSNSFICQQQKQISLKKQKSTLIYNNKINHLKNGNPNDLKKLKKYGSVLGYNSFPKVKSLVLKDIPDNGNEDEDEDEDDNLLSMKLRNALDNKQPTSNLIKFDNGNMANKSDEEELGLFSNGKGLKELIREKNATTKQNDDLDLEFTSKQGQEILYVPTGHLFLDENDMLKLNTYNSPYIIEIGNTSSYDIGNELLSLIQLDSDDDDSLIEPQLTSAINNDDTNKVNFHLNQNQTTDMDILSIEPPYDGNGLEPNELEDLLDF